jgi:hypothetical protein
MSNLQVVGEELDTVFGDAQTTALATGGVAELLKTLGQFGAGIQQKKEDAAKQKQAAADQAAYQQALADQQKAQLAANAETNQAGPAHMALIDANTRLAQAAAKVGMSGLAPSAPGAGGSPGPHRSGSFADKVRQQPLIAVGIAAGIATVLGTVIYFASRKKKR